MRYEGEEGKIRRRAKSENYYHLVWATKGRFPFLTPEYERRIHRCIVHQVQEMGCQVLAVGGMPDHVHLVVRAMGHVPPSEIVRYAKGAANRLYNDLRPASSETFRWQNGYGSYTLWYRHLDRAIHYVHDQKTHHLSGTGLYEPFEQFDEVAPDLVEPPVPYVFPDAS